jgi:hypothetical protein
LESAEQVAQIGMFSTERQDLPLNHSALDIIVFEHHVFLKTFDGEIRASAFQLG